jgi:hypothetical protein
MEERIRQFEELMKAVSKAIDLVQQSIEAVSAIARPDHVSRLLLVKEDLEIERNQIIREIINLEQQLVEED